MIKKIFICILCIIVLGCAKNNDAIAKKDWNKAKKQAIKRYGKPQLGLLKNYFKNAHVNYPPNDIALLAFKNERKLELWAKNSSSQWKLIHNYTFTAFSGKLGPKLRENDKQIPEGIYEINGMNPFSSFHLSMMLNYPNPMDMKFANKDGRKNLGNNIFIHGKSASVGCLAIGNKAIDQLFMLVDSVGLSHVKVIIAPNDLRKQKPLTRLSGQPKWLPKLYQSIKTELHHFIA
jgi:murein L,D-transpeptidase YafK